MIDFYFPDCNDVINPNYCFDDEEHELGRIRLQSEAYPHEIYARPPYDGMLVSQAIVKSRYTLAQRQRVMRQGIRKFLRLNNSKREGMKVIGDCGAFSYRNEEKPPYSVDEVIEFYQILGFDYGISLDHIILDYEDDMDPQYSFFEDPKTELKNKSRKHRQEITIELASEFFKKTNQQKVCFSPMGVAQGWSPSSYADSVKQIQKIGFDYIAIGGMVPLRSEQIEACLEAIAEVKHKRTRFHLLGISRIDGIAKFEKHGVVSIDSTAPLIQAFKSDHDNYHWGKKRYIALRIPQSGENNKLKARILAGEINQQETQETESDCLGLVRRFDQGDAGLDEVLDILCRYETFLTNRNPKNRSRLEITLRDQPWKKCKCPICKELGIQVIIFRGAERNRRRGFHNLYNYYSQLKKLKYA